MEEKTMKEEILEEIKTLEIDCPECKWMEDDQYQCTTCEWGGGDGKINVFQFLSGNTFTIGTP